MRFTLPNYFIMLVGLPASGKSTWINNNVFDKNFVVLSSDALIEEYAANNGKTYNEVFKEYIGTAENLFFGLVTNYLIIGKNIVIDRTNMSVKSRKRILDMVPPEYVKVAIITTCDDEEEYQKRLHSRPGKIIPDNVIESMRKSYQEPTEEEGFHSIVHIKTEHRTERY